MAEKVCKKKPQQTRGKKPADDKTKAGKGTDGKKDQVANGKRYFAVVSCDKKTKVSSAAQAACYKHFTDGGDLASYKAAPDTWMGPLVFVTAIYEATAGKLANMDALEVGNVKVHFYDSPQDAQAYMQAHCAQLDAQSKA